MGKKKSTTTKRKNAIQAVKGKIRAREAKRDEKGRFRPAESSSLYITTITNAKENK